jgi:hypothetical protein
MPDDLAPSVSMQSVSTLGDVAAFIAGQLSGAALSRWLCGRADPKTKNPST